LQASWKSWRTDLDLTPPGSHILDFTALFVFTSNQRPRLSATDHALFGDFHCLCRFVRFLLLAAVDFNFLR
jgi:hypothetical protein